MKRNIRKQWAVEQLETRYAPATLVNPFTVTYTQNIEPLGATKVAVKIDKPVFDQATIDTVFTFDTGGVDGDNSASQSLQKLDLTTLAAGGASLVITSLGGVRVIDATGLDLASVTVNGPLGAIHAGDADLTTPGLRLLQCRGLGPDSGPSVIEGDLGRAVINGAITELLEVHGDIGAVKAAMLDLVGRIRCDGDLGTVTLAGSIQGHNGHEEAGSITAGGNIGKVVVRGDVLGLNKNSARISSGNNIGLVRITGNLFVDNAFAADGLNAGRISALSFIGKVKIGGNVTGDDFHNTASIFASSGIGSVTIGGDVTGGAGVDSASICSQFGRIGSVKIGGSLVAGAGAGSGSIRAGRDLLSVQIAGDVTGLLDTPVIISAVTESSGSTEQDLAIGSVRIGGSANNALIWAGVDMLGSPRNADAQIGSVTVGGNWTNGSIAAGVDRGADGFFGTNDDALIADNDDVPTVAARIEKVVIRGLADGSAGGTDAFGFVAEEFAKVSIDAVFLPLSAGQSNDTIDLGTTGDCVLDEI